MGNEAMDGGQWTMGNGRWAMRRGRRAGDRGWRSEGRGRRSEDGGRTSDFTVDKEGRARFAFGYAGQAKGECGGRHCDLNRVGSLKGCENPARRNAPGDHHQEMPQPVGLPERIKLVRQNKGA